MAKSIPTPKYNIQTVETLFVAKIKFPDLVIEPPDYRLYIQASYAFVSLLRSYCPNIEQYSIDEVWANVSETIAEYGSPLMSAEFLRKTIYDELEFMVNIGVSLDKILTKMASGLKKPNVVHSLFPDKIKRKMCHLSVSELFFVGRATEEKLRNFGIYTIGHFANTDVKICFTGVIVVLLGLL